MAKSRTSQYGVTLVDNASIDQFVSGVMANDAAVVQRVGKMLAAGVGTALAVTAYDHYRGRRR
jgi:hypothetical protein